MSNSNEVNWDPAVWKEINDAVVMEMGKVRIAQKVFPTTVFDSDPTEIPNDVIDFPDPSIKESQLSIKEGQTKQFVEIYQEFPLTSAQVSKESQLKTCKTLARMAAKAIALAEDTVIFQGQKGTLPANVYADLIESAGDGLLGEANPRDASDKDPNAVSEPIPVDLAEPEARHLIWGEYLLGSCGRHCKINCKGPGTQVRAVSADQGICRYLRAAQRRQFGHHGRTDQTSCRRRVLWHRDPSGGQRSPGSARRRSHQSLCGPRGNHGVLAQRWFQVFLPGSRTHSIRST